MTKTQEIPAEIMAEARRLLGVGWGNQMQGVYKTMQQDIARALMAERQRGDTAARKECAEIAREAQRMRERLFSENEASINAHRAMQAMEIADSIEATIGGGDV